jgi:hypothetical protein
MAVIRFWTSDLHVYLSEFQAASKLMMCWIEAAAWSLLAGGSSSVGERWNRLLAKRAEIPGAVCSSRAVSSKLLGWQNLINFK